MSLTIDNGTNWDGRHLRRLCRRVIDHTDGYRERTPGSSPGAVASTACTRTITIRTSKSQRKEGKWKVARKDDDSCVVGTAANMYRGRASLGSRRKLYMGVPMVERQVDGQWYRHEFDVYQFARVLEHEILHNQGLRHGDMTDDVRYCRQEIGYDLSDIQVSPKPSFESRTRASAD